MKKSKTLTLDGSEMRKHLEIVERLKREVPMNEDSIQYAWYTELNEYIFSQKFEGVYWQYHQPVLKEKGNKILEALKDFELSKGNKIDEEWLAKTYEHLFDKDFQNIFWEYEIIEE